MTSVHADRPVPTRERLQAAPRRVHVLPMVTGVCVVALAVGYHLREEMYVTPDAGLGYGLGVAGLTAMAALLLYSVRKRVRALWSLGPLRHWFHVHMLLGVLGPVMILFHANFEVRSMNAAVALGTMLIVAGSGFIGRFAYARVHLGLFGQRETLRDVMARANQSRSALHRALRAVPSVEECVAEFETQVLEPPRDAFVEFWRVLAVGWRTRKVQRRARALLREVPAASLPASVDAIGRALGEHLRLVRRVSEFGFYERVLALWHALHVPLCFVLFIVAAIHVVAVHLY
jgi:hypothetical protein